MNKGCSSVKDSQNKILIYFNEHQLLKYEQ